MNAEFVPALLHPAYASPPRPPPSCRRRRGRRGGRRSRRRGARASARGGRRAAPQRLSFLRWIVTQATKVFFADESGKWIGRFSYLGGRPKKSRAASRGGSACVPAGPCWTRRRAGRGGGVGEAVAAVSVSRGRRGRGAGGSAGRGRRSTGRGCPQPFTAAEAAEGDAEGEAQVVGGGLGVELFDGRGAACPRGGRRRIGPNLGRSARERGPGGELDRKFAVGFVDSRRTASTTSKIDVASSISKTGSRSMSPICEVNGWVQRAQRLARREPSSSAQMRQRRSVRKD